MQQNVIFSQVKYFPNQLIFIKKILLMQNSFELSSGCDGMEI